MRRILLSALVLVGLGAFLLIAGGASDSGGSDPTYKIELDNAFGLVNGADFKVAGVRAGTINSIDLPSGCAKGDTTDCHALVTVKVTQTGFGSFRSDAFCQSRPQSLIGEYFIECEPGTAPTVIKPGGTIPITRTQTTIPADLLNDIMRMPYRERFSLIINELGAGVAARSSDLQAALRRAVPALDETDNLLNLLANDSNTLQQLTANSDAVITALANNSANVQRFITEANNAATDSATQQSNLAATWHKLPGFLEQLRPTLAQLSSAIDTNQPVLANLNAATGHSGSTVVGPDQLNRFFSDLVPFSHASLPALKSLGKASVTGKVAVTAARPTIKELDKFSKPTPELAQNLAIVLHDLDDRSRAVETDRRSPGGKGYTGLEALLQYVFNQALAINEFSQYGHMLAVDAFVDPACSPYATAATVASGLSSSPPGFGPAYRRCYAWVGPNQPGINEQDPSAPHACVPDPGYGGEGRTPTGPPAPCKLTAADVSKSSKAQRDTAATSTPSTPATARAPSRAGSSSSLGPPIDLHKTLGQILSGLGGVVAGAAPTGTTSGDGGSSSGNQAQQLLNYLLAP
jgi:virulence factor Mce-like protein